MSNMQTALRVESPFKVVTWPLMFVVLIAVIFFMEDAGVVQWRRFGIRPREWEGLTGIIAAPFLHGSKEHLFNNSIPLFVLTWSLLYFYKELFWRAIAWIIVISGVLVWLSGREGTNHIGASGLIYGLVGFLFFSGILRKHPPLIAISMLMVFLYGSMVWGILPVQEHISWEGHLWGGVIGTVMAFYFKPEGPQRRRYAWEDEEEDEDEEDAYWKRDVDRTLNPDARPVRVRYHIRKGSRSSEKESTGSSRQSEKRSTDGPADSPTKAKGSSSFPWEQ